MEATEQIDGQQVIDTHSPITPQMSVGSWIVTFLLLAIPLVNIIMVFIWAFDRASERRNFARAYLIIAVIVIALWILIAIAVFALGASTGIFDWIFQ